tara:strand:- start:63 stop:227 length:165 start_codon:yes stop_codon:yes gene_type:complete
MSVWPTNPKQEENMSLKSIIEERKAQKAQDLANAMRRAQNKGVQASQLEGAETR